MFNINGFTRKQKNFIDRFYENEHIKICEEDIKIFTGENKYGNKLVIAKWKTYNNEVIVMSICHKNDKYSLNKGVDIAVRKLLSKIVNIRYQDKMKDFHNMIKDYEKHLKPMKEFIENNKRYINILNKKLN